MRKTIRENIRNIMLYKFNNQNNNKDNKLVKVKLA